MKTMKKIFTCTFCLMIVFLITGCGKKKISVEKFNSDMEKKNYTIINAGENEELGLTKSSIAKDEDNKYIIEFYQFDSFERSKYMYHKTKLEISSLAVKGSTSGEISRKKYLKYVLTNNDYYYVVSNVDNTLLIAYTKVENKSELKEIIKKIGY